MPAKEGVDKWLITVIPVKTGIHKYLKRMDARFLGNDEKNEIPCKSTPAKAGIPLRRDSQEKGFNQKRRRLPE